MDSEYDINGMDISAKQIIECKLRLTNSINILSVEYVDIVTNWKSPSRDLFYKNFSKFSAENFAKYIKTLEKSHTDVEEIIEEISAIEQENISLASSFASSFM